MKTKSRKIPAGKGQPEKIVFSRQTIIILCSILVITFLLFAANLKNEVLVGWDDGVYLEDAFVKNLCGASISHYFTTYYLGMYQPIGVFTFALNFAFHGESALGYQLVNLLLHLLNTFLVFIFIRKLKNNDIFALFVTALFAVHPMHVEAVSWIATRSNALYSMFFLLAAIQFVNYIQSKFRIKYLIYSMLFFLPALFSKSMAMSFPFVLLLIDYFYGRSISRKVLWEKLPFFLLSLIFGIVTVKAAQSFGHIETLTYDYNFLHRILLLSFAVFFYLWKMVVPVNLSTIYTYPEVENGFLPYEYYISILALLAIVLWILKARKIKRELIFGFGFFLVSIGPVLPFFWSRIFIVAERYTYISYLGLFFVLALVLNKYFESKQWQKFFSASWVYGVLGLWMLFLMGATYNRTLVWHSTTVLLNDVIHKENSENDVAAAHFYLGNLYDQNKDFVRAYEHFSDAIRLNPEYVLAYNNRGIILGSQGRNQEALEDFNRVLTLKPDYAEGWYNRGIVFYQTGRTSEACNDWLKAARLGSEQAAIVRAEYCK